MKRFSTFVVVVCAVVIATSRFAKTAVNPPLAAEKYDPTTAAVAEISAMRDREHDWPQWGGWSSRNNTPAGTNIPDRWNIEDGTNIKWSAKLGSQSYGNPVVANGKVYVGTNNGAGYLTRYPASVDLGCLLCFDEKTGEFLWQHSSNKLPAGRVYDWPQRVSAARPASAATEAGLSRVAAKSFASIRMDFATTRTTARSLRKKTPTRMKPTSSGSST